MKRKIASAMCLVMMGANFVAPIYADTAPFTVDGEGTTTYVNTEHYEVVVPTSAALDFNLDPQNLLALGDDDEKPLNDLRSGSVAAGAIYGTTPLVFANLGTDDVSISASFDVTGDTTVLYDDTDDVVENDNSAFNIKLALVPYKVNVDDSVSYKMNSTTANALRFTASSTAFKSNSDDKVRGVAFGDDNTNSTLTFKLGAPSWNIVKKAENSFELKMDESTNDKAVAFAIGGTCNSKADWSDFKKDTSPKTVGITATFTLAKAADDFTPTVDLNLGDEDTDPTVAIPTGSTKKLIEVPVLEDEEVATPKLGNATVAAGASSASMTFENIVDGTVFDTTYLGVNYNGGFNLTKYSKWSGSSVNATTGNVTLNANCITWIKSNATAESDGSYAITIKDTEGETYTGYLTIND